MVYIFLFVSYLWADPSLIAAGSIYKEKNSEVAYYYERYHDSKANIVMDRSVYKEPQGKVLVEEKMKTVMGKLLRYDIKQMQSSENGWIVIDNNQVMYGVKDNEGKIREVKRSVPENFIVPLGLLPFIQNNWKALMSNKTVNLKLGVWKRQNHYSFFMRKVSSGDGLIVIKMQLSNIILRALTSPLYFSFDLESNQIKSYSGPLNLKKKKGEGFTDFIGYVVYDLKEGFEANKISE